MRATLYCIQCGHELHAVDVPDAKGRPSARQLRAAYETDLAPVRPLWRADTPQCPRCRAQMFLQLTATRRELASEIG